MDGEGGFSGDLGFLQEGIKLSKCKIVNHYFKNMQFTCTFALLLTNNFINKYPLLYISIPHCPPPPQPIISQLIFVDEASNHRRGVGVGPLLRGSRHCRLLQLLFSSGWIIIVYTSSPNRSRSPLSSPSFKYRSRVNKNSLSACALILA